jgi:hypothetical protein
MKRMLPLVLLLAAACSKTEAPAPAAEAAPAPPVPITNDPRQGAAQITGAQGVAEKANAANAQREAEAKAALEAQ